MPSGRSGAGHGIGPWEIRRRLDNPGPGRESETLTETATPSDSGTELGTGARRETGASGGTGIGTGRGRGTEATARTDIGSGSIALVNKEFGKNPAKAGREKDPGGPPGTQPRPPGPRLGKPRNHCPTGRRASGAADLKGEVGCDLGAGVPGQPALLWRPRATCRGKPV